MTTISTRTRLLAAALLLIALLTASACGGNAPGGSGDPAYEKQVITIGGLKGDGDTEDVTVHEISIAELRKLPQHELDASYQRTTGMTETFKMSGPYLKDVVAHLNGKLEDYAGIGVIGKDGYYCLVPKEVIGQTPDLMLALNIDGEAKLDEENAPARLAVQGQFGPYWVKQVEKIMLYEEIPQKTIASVWVFSRLAQGIKPYEYEYYGSKDAAIDLAQIFSRLDKVDGRAFFTMKSADGFTKNEVIDMVKSRYYIKVEGKDAPTNVSPQIKLGMNVQNIAWVSTNADAAIFPNKLAEYMEQVERDGRKGIALDEVLYEAGIKTVKGATFDLLGTQGEKVTVAGDKLNRGILTPRPDGGAGVVWERATGLSEIKDLLRIKRVAAPPTSHTAPDQPPAKTDPAASAIENGQSATGNKPAIPPAAPAGQQGQTGVGPDTVVSIVGDGVGKPLHFSLSDLQGLSRGYREQIFSIVNNYPTKKFAAAKGVAVHALLEQAQLKSRAKTITVEAADGYKASFTRDQLLGQRYRYPELLKGSTGGASPVEAMLAWIYGEGQNFSKAKADDLRLVVGQQGLNDVNTAVNVQNVSKIIVSLKDPGAWPMAEAALADGRITLKHASLDQVKLYYTLDGSAPTENSPVYNPSTTYFQPDLIKPIAVSGSGTLKVIVIGYGKRDSQILSFPY